MSDTKPQKYCTVQQDGNLIGGIFYYPVKNGFRFISALPHNPGRSRKFVPSLEDCKRSVRKRFPAAEFTTHSD